MARIIRETNTDRFNHFMISSIISSLVIFCLGLIVYLFSEKIELFIGYIMGLIFLWYGINTIIKYLKRDGARLYSLNLVFGIIMLTLGVLIIIVPRSVASFIMVCLGLYFITIGANKITYGVWLKIGNNRGWLMTFFIGLMMILFGILMFINPFEMSITTTKVIGIFIMLTSALDLADTLMLKKRQEEIVKIFW